jgi:hypothetical protein
MSKWLQEKQMTAFEVTYQGKTKTLQDWAKGVNIRDRLRLGSDERANFRDIVNVVSGLALNQQFAEVSPEYPTFPVLVTESNRKQLVGNALKALAGGTRTKDANAILDALEMLDGDRIEPGRSRYSQEVLSRLKAKGHGQVLNRSELLNGPNRRGVLPPGEIPPGARPAGGRAGRPRLLRRHRVGHHRRQDRLRQDHAAGRARPRRSQAVQACRSAEGDQRRRSAVVVRTARPVARLWRNWPRKAPRNRSSSFSKPSPSWSAVS